MQRFYCKFYGEEVRVICLFCEATQFRLSRHTRREREKKWK